MRFSACPLWTDTALIRRNLTRLLLLTTLFLPISVVAASTIQELEAETETYLLQTYHESEPQARIDIKLNPLSSHVNLVRCRLPVQFYMMSKRGSQVRVRAKCTGPAWQIYITGRVKVFKPVVTAATLIPKGRLIQYQHLRTTEHDVASLRQDYVGEIESIIGMAAKYNIRPGSLIKPSQLVTATLINKGDAVTIEARRGGLSIRATGTALQKGKAGEQISVRNEKSGRSIRAVVIAPGLVRTP